VKAITRLLEAMLDSHQGCSWGLRAADLVVR